MNFYDHLQSEISECRTELFTIPIIQRAVSGSVSLDDYVGYLSQAYHHVKHTVPLLMSVGGRLPEQKEWLRVATSEYIEEEIGHQEWVLNDIAACGYEKEWVRSSSPHTSTELMIAYAYDLVHRVNPVAFFGMVQVLEGTSVALADKAASNIESSLALPRNAFSYLYSHGSLDQDHLKFFEELMNKIDSREDQEIIVHSAKMFYKLYGDIFRSLEEHHSIPAIQQK